MGATNGLYQQMMHTGGCMGACVIQRSFLIVIDAHNMTAGTSAALHYFCERCGGGEASPLDGKEDILVRVVRFQSTQPEASSGVQLHRHKWPPHFAGRINMIHCLNRASFDQPRMMESTPSRAEANRSQSGDFSVRGTRGGSSTAVVFPQRPGQYSTVQ